MGLALRSFDFYDLMDRVQVADSGHTPRYGRDYLPIENVDTSEPVMDLDAVYTEAYSHGKITIMTAFRKDLFVSITLPILGLGVIMFGAIAGSFAYTYSSFNRLDDHSKALQLSVSDVNKAQAVTAEQTSAMVKAQEATNSKLDKVVDQLGAVSTSLEVLKSQRSTPSS